MKLKELNMDKATELVLGKIENWTETFVSMLPNLIVAVLVFILFYIIARGVRKLSLKLTARVSDNQALNRLIATIIYIGVLGVGIFTALSVLKLDRAVTSLLTGAGIIGLALSFAFQDSATNFISGIFMAMRKPFHIGDIIETADTMGKVDKMNLRNTVLLTFQGQFVYVPNKEVYQNKLINYTALGKRRIDIIIGVSYADDLQKAQKASVEAVNSLDFVIEKDKTAFLLNEFGNSSITGLLILWIEYQGQTGYLEAQSESIIAVKKAFDENDITIPFPIRTLDFGIKGGEKLSPSMLKVE